MAYSPELMAKIRRLHFYEHYTVHAVSKIVGLHRDTVKRILYGDDEIPESKNRVRITDAYLPVIEQHLEQYPSIRSTALLKIIKDRGYTGSYQTLLRVVRPLKKKIKRSFKPMQAFPGEQGQVDWAHFGSLKVKGGERKLYLFVMVLSWSRALFARFSFDQKTDSFLRLHEQAFRYFGGSPRSLLYDNLKSAVLERYRDKIKFNPQLIEFSGFYGFEPKPCRPYAGNEKGRVERAIRYIRDSFASGYTISDIDQANEDLKEWLNDTADERPWPDNKQRSVRDVWQEEKGYLLDLADRNVSPKHALEVRSSKTSLVRFDLNDYSIPWQYTREVVSLEADDLFVSFYKNAELIAQHPRSWGRGERLINREHWQDRPNKPLHVMDHFIGQFPELDEFYRVEMDRGESLAQVKNKMLEMNRLYGDELFRKALRIARKKEMHHPSQVMKILVGLENAGQKVPTPLNLAKRQDIEDLDIKSHDLETYDNL